MEIDKDYETLLKTLNTTDRQIEELYISPVSVDKVNETTWEMNSCGNKNIFLGYTVGDKDLGQSYLIDISDTPLLFSNGSMNISEPSISNNRTCLSTPLTELEFHKTIVATEPRQVYNKSGYHDSMDEIVSNIEEDTEIIGVNYCRNQYYYYNLLKKDKFTIENKSEMETNTIDTVITNRYNQPFVELTSSNRIIFVVVTGMIGPYKYYNIERLVINPKYGSKLINFLSSQQMVQSITNNFIKTEKFLIEDDVIKLMNQIATTSGDVKLYRDGEELSNMFDDASLPDDINFKVIFESDIINNTKGIFVRFPDIAVDENNKKYTSIQLVQNYQFIEHMMNWVEDKHLLGKYIIYDYPRLPLKNLVTTELNGVLAVYNNIGLTILFPSLYEKMYPVLYSILTNFTKQGTDIINLGMSGLLLDYLSSFSIREYIGDVMAENSSITEQAKELYLWFNDLSQIEKRDYEQFIRSYIFTCYNSLFIFSNLDDYTESSIYSNKYLGLLAIGNFVSNVKNLVETIAYINMDVGLSDNINCNNTIVCNTFTAPVLKPYGDGCLTVSIEHINIEKIFNPFKLRNIKNEVIANKVLDNKHLSVDENYAVSNIGKQEVNNTSFGFNEQSYSLDKFNSSLLKNFDLANNKHIKATPNNLKISFKDNLEEFANSVQNHKSIIRAKDGYRYFDGLTGIFPTHLTNISNPTAQIEDNRRHSYLRDSGDSIIEGLQLGIYNESYKSLISPYSKFNKNTDINDIVVRSILDLYQNFSIPSFIPGVDVVYYLLTNTAYSRQLDKLIANTINPLPYSYNIDFNSFSRKSRYSYEQVIEERKRNFMFSVYESNNATNSVLLFDTSALSDVGNGIIELNMYNDYLIQLSYPKSVLVNIPETVESSISYRWQVLYENYYNSYYKGFMTDASLTTSMWESNLDYYLKTFDKYVFNYNTVSHLVDYIKNLIILFKNKFDITDSRVKASISDILYDNLFTNRNKLYGMEDMLLNTLKLGIAQVVDRISTCIADNNTNISKEDFDWIYNILKTHNILDVVLQYSMRYKQGVTDDLVFSGNSFQNMIFAYNTLTTSYIKKQNEVYKDTILNKQYIDYGDYLIDISDVNQSVTSAIPHRHKNIYTLNKPLFEKITKRYM